MPIIMEVAVSSFAWQHIEDDIFRSVDDREIRSIPRLSIEEGNKLMMYH